MTTPFRWPKAWDGVFVENRAGDRYPVIGISNRVVTFRLPDGGEDMRGFDDEGRFPAEGLRVVRGALA